MASNELPIAVVGAGTVGSILIAHLIEAGHENLAIVDIPQRLKQIEKVGLQISNVRTLKVKPAHLFSDVMELKDRGVRSMIVSTKATEIARVAPKIKEIHHPDMIVMSMHNGLGTEREIAGYIDPSRVGRMVVNFAGVRDETTGEISMSWFIPPNVIGPHVDSDMQPWQDLAAEFTEAGLATEARTHVEVKRAVWFKAILNAALNALCATTGLTMAEAMRMRHTRYLARQLLREGLTVASHMGYAYGEGALETCMNYLDKGGEHYPSMWSDLKKGRRTEIDYINGKIVRNSMMYTDIHADLNMFFTNMVMTQEIRSGVRKVQEIPSYLGCTVRLCY